ncbi:MAG TPA: hypothetical protein VN493_13935 [Thermoanaerobaculia bacterium]|nr:hypothetical protein [Thermoanaerobaculia bacterium]
MRPTAPTKARWILGLSLALGMAASAWAEPAKLMSPLEKLETVEGSVVVRKAGQALVMNLPGQDGHGRWFRVEAARGASLPAGFRADSAQVLYWMGHLVLIAEGKAWHFTVPGRDTVVSAAAQVPGAAELEALLRGYEVTQVQASAIYSANGPRADRLNEGLRNLFAQEDDHQDPGGSGGIGSCGSSCSIQCGGGSNCSATCGAPRCAHCSCPASCSCS